MIRALLITLLTLAVVGTGYFAYQEHQDKNAVLIHAENQYQRAFHDLVHQLNSLHDQLGIALAMNSRKQLSPALAEVWRLTSEAQSDVGQLPLTLLPFNKTEEYLSQIGDFTYKTAVRDLDKQPLTDQEYQTLKRLYDHADEISTELKKVQTTVLNKHLRWMDIEVALASNKKPTDNTIIDGFQTVDKKISGYENINTRPDQMSIQKLSEKRLNEVKGPMITAEEAKTKAEQFIGKKGLKKSISTNLKGAKFPFYQVQFVDETNGSTYQVNVLKKGGHILWMLHERPVNKPSIGLNEASERAKTYVKNKGFAQMDVFDTTQYDSIGVFTFIGKRGDVRIFPETIRIKVALDNGEIVGYDARSFLMNHKSYPIGKEALTIDEAKTKINPNVKIEEIHRSVIINDMGEEVYCYEFLGRMEDQTYRIFINAITGDEEKVEHLKQTEENYESL